MQSNVYCKVWEFLNFSNQYLKPFGISQDCKYQFLLAILLTISGTMPMKVNKCTNDL
jgi:hypothetical protein